MDPAKLLRTTPVARERGQLRAGLRYVRSLPVLSGLLAMVFVVSTFGINFSVTLPLLSNNVFHAGPEVYGLLTTVFAAGSLCGAVIGARRVGRPRLRMVAGTALVFGICETAAGLMPTVVTTGILLVPTGLAALAFTTAVNSSVQLSIEPSMRGRVMGLYFLLFVGGTPLGAPLLGLLAEHYGGRAPTVAGGVLSVLAVLVVVLWLRRSLARRPGPSAGASSRISEIPSGDPLRLEQG
jgi:predicted MFS family arabinose efflux permease